MITKEQIIAKYEEIYSKIRNKYQKRHLTKNDESTLDKFLNQIHLLYNINTIDELFLHDYVCYQFAIRYDRQTRLNGKIPLNHIVGKKAIEMWINKNESWSYWKDIFIDKFNITHNKEKLKTNSLKLTDEEERKRYINTEKGFLHCLYLEIDYSNKSKYCIACSYKSVCKNN